MLNAELCEKFQTLHYVSISAGLFLNIDLCFLSLPLFISFSTNFFCTCREVLFHHFLGVIMPKHFSFWTSNPVGK